MTFRLNKHSFLPDIFELKNAGNGMNGILFAAPAADFVAMLVVVGLTILFFQSLGKDTSAAEETKTTVIQPSRKGTIITIAGEHGSAGKQIGKIVAERLHVPFYYKEMTDLAAQESGLDKEFISNINTNSSVILHDYDDVVRIFIHASKEFRIGKVMEVYGDSRSEAVNNIKRSDEARADYYKNISGLLWGDVQM